jgi:hypothetical protein
MPALTFPLSPDGMRVDVLVTYDTVTLQSLLAAGQPIPPSIPGKGLLDTGTDVSTVAASIIQQLGLPVHSYDTTQGIAGPVSVRLFVVTLFILDASQRHLPWLDQPDLLVIEQVSALPVEALIGMDVLLGCKLFLDGPGGWFSLEF